MKHVQKAEELFVEGYNCAQAVFAAFCEDMQLPFETALKLSSSFGGGMGRMREVCGACSAMFMVAGLLYGYDSPTDNEAKAVHYARIRDLADAFRKENGSIICRDILKGEAQVGGTPEKRTDAYYKARPCVRCVQSAAQIMEQYMNENPQ